AARTRTRPPEGDGGAARGFGTLDRIAVSKHEGASMAVESQRVEDFRIAKEPYYLPLGNEVELFESAYHARLPVMLKGPTGCGKTRFVEHMSWRLERTLVTVACHEDLTASDLVGKYTLRGDETVWQDGP